MDSRLAISRDGLQRLIVCRQGLLPGHYGEGFTNVEQAVRSLGALQMDPLTIVARSHELVLHARVAGYQPAMLSEVTYDRGALFEYGGVLSVRPRDHLPFWRRHMQARRKDPRYIDAMSALGDDGRRLMRSLSIHGPQTASQVAARLGEMTNRPADRRGSYRSQGTVSKGLYQLWLGGKVVTHSRTVGFERVYDRSTVTVAMASPRSTLDFFLTQALHGRTACTAANLRQFLAAGLHRKVTRAECDAALARLEQDGVVRHLMIEGERFPHLVLSRLTPLVETMRDTPAQDNRDNWIVSLLPPLDPIVAAMRDFFDFTYVWEIYKPESQRQYGPFTMPILYGHQLVGRADLRTDRDASTLVVNGAWLDEPALEHDDRFVLAMAAALQRLATFVGVDDARIARDQRSAWMTSLRRALTS